MKLILDKGCISYERTGGGRPPSSTHILKGFVLWVHEQGLRGLDAHFGFPVDQQARRLLLTNSHETRPARLWADRISQGRVTINGRIICELTDGVVNEQRHPEVSNCKHNCFALDNI